MAYRVYLPVERPGQAENNAVSEPYCDILKELRELRTAVDMLRLEVQALHTPQVVAIPQPTGTYSVGDTFYHAKTEG